MTANEPVHQLVGRVPGQERREDVLPFLGAEPNRVRDDPGRLLLRDLLHRPDGNLQLKKVQTCLNGCCVESVSYFAAIISRQSLSLSLSLSLSPVIPML